MPVLYTSGLPGATAKAPELVRLHATVYNFPSDLEIMETARDACGHAWGAFEKGRLRSAMVSIPFTMMLDGGQVPMAGIGGVGTFPEDRRHGYVRLLFDRVFDDMRERGQGFSTLYPYSFPYYRGFGYELAYSRFEYEFPLSDIDPAGRRGTMEEVSAADPSAASAVYDRFAASRNLATVRGGKSWKRRLKEKPHRDLVYACVCRDENGAPASYFQFKAEPRGPHNIAFVCLDLAWTGSLAAALLWFSVFRSRAERATVHLPTDGRPELLFAEPYHLTQRVSATLMARVVNVERALSRVRGPAGAGVVLAVKDDCLKWNNGAFEVAWDAEGEARVGRCKKSRASPWTSGLSRSLRLVSWTARRPLRAVFSKRISRRGSSGGFSRGKRSTRTIISGRPRALA